MDDLKKTSDKPDLEHLRHQLQRASYLLDALGHSGMASTLIEVRELLSKGTLGVFEMADGTKLPLHLWDAVKITTLGTWQPSHVTDGETVSAPRGVLR
jgi:hypothetical protein